LGGILGTILAALAAGRSGGGSTRRRQTPQ
jgi:hypothetical protein